MSGSSDLWPVIFRVSDGDVLEYVNDGGRAFARDNISPLAESLVGSRIWDLFTDPNTEHLYRALLRRVRQLQITARLPFRWDSPDLWRRMRLTVAPLEGGRIEFRAVLESEKPRTADDPWGSASEGPKFLRMCSWCNAISVQDAWQPIERALEEQQLLLALELPSITHGICDGCAVEFEKEGSGRE